VITLYDSVSLDAIPAAAIAVAGYVNGKWPTFANVLTRWPNAAHLSIAVSADADADCLDIERYDATPDQAPDWVHRQMARGLYRPAVYCSVSGALDVIDRLASAGIARTAVRLWIAHYGIGQHLCGPSCGYGAFGADATQWTSRYGGRNLDASVVPDYSFFLNGVVPMFDPPLAAPTGIAAAAKTPAGGVILAGPDGAVYALFGAVYHGGANGQGYFAGRKVAQVETHPDGSYTLIATSGERYDYR
jgi:hypothetical protein